jgi:small subunit ribosomal protein S3
VGQKTHPVGFRIGVTKNWSSRWFTKKDYKTLISEDQKIRKYIEERFERAAISTIEIERTRERVDIIIHTARPGIIIGRRGAEIDRLRDELKLVVGKPISIKIEEIRIPEADAKIVAESIARQIEERVSYRRAMKKAITRAMRLNVKGIKVLCKGRLGGAEIARSEWYRKGRVPLQTLRADIDYAYIPAKTMSGIIGVKVWIYKGEKIGMNYEG